MTTSGPQSSGGDPSRDPGSTSLPAAGRVSRFLLPGVGWVVMTPGGSGQPWPMSSPSCGPPSSSVRTSSVTGPVTSDLSWPTLHRLATKPGPALSALARWAPHTHGPGCSSWPTPKASDAGRGSLTPAGIARRAERTNTGLSIPDVIGGQPNPEWIEWLMGFPAGWTDCGPSETL